VIVALPSQVHVDWNDSVCAQPVSSSHPFASASHSWMVGSRQLPAPRPASESPSQ